MYTKLTIGMLAFLCLFLVFIHTTPRTCSEQAILVGRGESIHDIATTLHQNGCLRSEYVFEKYGVAFNVQPQEGRFVIPYQNTLFGYLFAFSSTHFMEQVRFLIPEGANHREITLTCSERMTTCDADTFSRLSQQNEGYLFPNTYLFSGTESAEDMIATFRKEFDSKTAQIFDGLSEERKREIIILASILEKEANTEEDMRIIAGILERRLAIDMPLQVDATLFYERGKTSAELTINDLRTPSPFNTYTNKGLPPAPIGNPGMVAIRAVIDPIPSAYLFYLTGRDGKMYYAEDHDTHVRNKDLYLR